MELKLRRVQLKPRRVQLKAKACAAKAKVCAAQAKVRGAPGNFRCRFLKPRRYSDLTTIMNFCLRVECKYCISATAALQQLGEGSARNLASNEV